VSLRQTKQTVKSTRTNSLTSSSTGLTRKFLSTLRTTLKSVLRTIYEGPHRNDCRRDLDLYAVQLCEDSPSANAIVYHLRTKFEPEQLERVANTLLRREIVELLPEQVVCADLHLGLYHGDEDDTDSLYHSEAKRGTTAFHAYTTLFTRVCRTNGIRWRPAVYLDRGFYDSKCLTLLYAHNYAYVIPIIQ